MKKETVLEVKDLRTYFNTDDGVVKAVDGVSFALKSGEVLGIVGESGSGKSVTNLSLMQLIPSPPGKIESGEVLYRGQDLLKLDDEGMRQIRGNKISMIFQDPMTSLNPYLKISTQLIETIQLHQKVDKDQAREKAIEMLKLVEIPGAENRIDNYPHQMSGGMRQRVMIAMALSCRPDLLIADEPTTALDVTIQAQVLELIKELGARTGASVILITHDLGVVAGLCDRILVMYAGRVVEEGTTESLFAQPLHPYTQGLLKSIPRLDKETQGELYSIPGLPPNVVDLPECCPFYPRCEKAMDICHSKYPPTKEQDGGQEVACWLYAKEEK
jgi:oligopeptide/dipeptide ABC transporter ATP-binding protein